MNNRRVFSYDNFINVRNFINYRYSKFLLICSISTWACTEFNFKRDTSLHRPILVRINLIINSGNNLLQNSTFLFLQLMKMSDTKFYSIKYFITENLELFDMELIENSLT